MEQCSLSNRDSSPFFSSLPVIKSKFSFLIGRRSFANAAVNVLEKDYYTILDIPVTATPE